MDQVFHDGELNGWALYLLLFPVRPRGNAEEKHSLRRRELGRDFFWRCSH
jgi:hypothetical protein